MNADPLVLVPLTSLCFHVALLVLLRNDGRPLRTSVVRPFRFYLAWMTLWSACSVAWRLSIGTDAELHMLQIVSFCGLSLPAVFLYFLQAAYPSWWSWLARGHAAIMALLIAAGIGSNAMIRVVMESDATPAPWEYVLTYTALSAVVGSHVLTLTYLASAYRANNEPMERNRLKYLGIVLLLTIAGLYSNTIPALQQYPLDQAINAAAAGLLAFSIARPQLVNMNTIVRCALSYVVMSASVTAVYLGCLFLILTVLDWRLFSLRGVVVAMLLSVGVGILGHHFQFRAVRMVDHLVAGGRFNHRRALLEFSRQMVGVLSLQELVSSASELCMRALDARYVTVLLPDEQNGAFRIAHAAQPSPHVQPHWTISAENRLLAAAMAAGRPVTVLELERHVEASGATERDRAELAPYRSGVLSPVTSHGRHIALVIVGPKDSGRAYSLDDLELLTIVTRHAAVAFENARLFTQVQHQAQTDALTGLPDRAAFMKRLEDALTAAAGRQQQVAIFFLDLDRFKIINDGLGHAAGDELLTTISQRLTRAVGPEVVVARFGGDEFTLLQEHADERTATAVAERTLEELREPFTLGGHEVTITASIGVALSSPSSADSADDLLRNADAALYQAKAAGKARCALFRDHIPARSIQRLDLETELRHAIERDQLEIFYQPEVDLRTGRIAGVEALVRWNHPRHGRISPATFIPLAEENGFITSIGRWVLARACRQAQSWRMQGLGDTTFALNVNVSPKELQQGELLAQVAQTLTESGLPPQQLRLEITESVLVGDLCATAKTLASLKDLGVQLAIDDFGAGRTSLTYLHRFPVDTLKIDQSFVRELGLNERSLPIVRAVVQAAHDLGMAVTAEGIETSAQLARLQDIDCDAGQGYYFSAPLPTGAMEQLLTSAPFRSAVRQAA